MIADVIRNANSEHEVYRLLTSYIQSVPYPSKAQARIAEPITGISDVKKRFTQLMFELDKASKSLDDNSCATIKEGMHALSVALDRLYALNGQQGKQTH